MIGVFDDIRITPYDRIRRWFKADRDWITDEESNEVSGEYSPTPSEQSAAAEALLQIERSASPGVIKKLQELEETEARKRQYLDLPSGIVVEITTKMTEANREVIGKLMNTDGTKVVFTPESTPND
jgi:hypothetical protein